MRKSFSLWSGNVLFLMLFKESQACLEKHLCMVASALVFYHYVFNRSEIFRVTKILPMLSPS